MQMLISNCCHVDRYPKFAYLTCLLGDCHQSRHNENVIDLKVMKEKNYKNKLHITQSSIRCNAMFNLQSYLLVYKVCLFNR